MAKDRVLVRYLPFAPWAGWKLCCTLSINFLSTMRVRGYTDSDCITRVRHEPDQCTTFSLLKTEGHVDSVIGPHNEGICRKRRS